MSETDAADVEAIAFQQQQALLGIAEAAEGLVRLIDGGSYTLRLDLLRAEWAYIAAIARRPLELRLPTTPADASEPPQADTSESEAVR